MKRQVTGKISQEQHLVKTTITRVSGGWLKVTPTESLAPGEYVLVEMMPLEGGSGKEGMNLYVWDFGVNPKAPANANPWKPSVSEPKLDPISQSQIKWAECACTGTLHFVKAHPCRTPCMKPRKQ